jgi:hypothetical protein
LVVRLTAPLRMKTALSGPKRWPYVARLLSGVARLRY